MNDHIGTLRLTPYTQGKVLVACPRCKWESGVLSESIKHGEVIECSVCHTRFYFSGNCLSLRDQEKAKRLVSQQVMRTQFNRLRPENLRLKIEV